MKKASISIYDYIDKINEIVRYIKNRIKKESLSEKYIAFYVPKEICDKIKFISKLKIAVIVAETKEHDLFGAGEDYADFVERDNIVTNIVSHTDTEIIKPLIVIKVPIYNNEINYNTITHVLFHELNHSYQSYLKKEDEWYYWSSLKGCILTQYLYSKTEKYN